MFVVKVSTTFFLTKEKLNRAPAHAVVTIAVWLRTVGPIVMKNIRILGCSCQNQKGLTINGGNALCF